MTGYAVPCSWNVKKYVKYAQDKTDKAFLRGSLSNMDEISVTSCATKCISQFPSQEGIKVIIPLQWYHNECNGVSNHWRLNGLLNRLFRCWSKKTSKFCITGLCEGNSPVTSEFPSQRASNTENVSIRWHHHSTMMQHQMLWCHRIKSLSHPCSYRCFGVIDIRASAATGGLRSSL